MPKNLDSVEKLFGKHSSDPFNPKLAQVFFKSGLIEAWGRGFDKIKAGCEEYGGELPGYDLSANGAMVLCKACPEYLKLLENNVEMAGESAGKSEGKTEGKRSGRSCDKILKVLSREPTLTREALAIQLGLSLSRVENVIRELRTGGKLVREGSSRNGRWKVVSK